MCLIVFSWKNHPKYDLIVTANRDEFLERPTLPAQWWEENPSVLAGKDLIGKGTWLGITKERKFAALTNYRDIKRLKSEAPTRGLLTADFLNRDISPSDYLDSLTEIADQYNGFNLLVGDQESLWYFNNVNFEKRQLTPGNYGLSNGLLDDSWPKVTKSKSLFEQAVGQGELTTQGLIELMLDSEVYPDSTLPETGLPLDKERGVSAIFIMMENYGTRCTTAILSSHEKTLFSERTYELPNQQANEVRIEFVRQ